ncbi:MAG: primase-helicase family protein [Candidatus Accumulibacter sp. UW20]
MDTLEFLQQILPGTGLVVLAELRTRPDGSSWIHHKFADIASAAAAVERFTAAGRTIYHACSTFKEDLQKRFRTQENAGWQRAFWVDADVDPANPAKYANKKAALQDAVRACKELGLPSPTVVDSGGGLHLYWPMAEDMTTAVWTPIAEQFKARLTAIGFKQDPSRTADSASVLRPVGSFNRKREPARPVVSRFVGRPMQLADFAAAVGAVVSAATITQAADDNDDLGGGMEYPASSADRIIQFCPTLAHVATLLGNVGEPLWHKMIGVIKHTTEGEARCHEWSAGHPAYCATDTQQKIDNWATGPSTCASLKQTAENQCAGCTQTCKSPIQLGYSAEAAATGGKAASWLDGMNEEYAWIEQDAAIYRRKHRDFIRADSFHMAHANAFVAVATPSGTKQAAVSRLWLTNPRRSQFRAIVTKPGDPTVTADGCLNDWAGFAVDPVPGNVEPFESLYGYLFEDERYPLQWLAHLVQSPGIKMFVSLVVWSQQEGVGKNLLFETIGALFSPHHYALIGQSEVDDDFCGWIPGTVFVLADEVRASKSDKSRDKLKIFTTATTLRTHDKGQPKRVVENLLNAVYLSNHADGMFLSGNDRRFFVAEVLAGPLPEALKQPFLQWRCNGGLTHLLHYLQNLDLTGFDPKGHAPATKSKDAMVDAGRSDLDRWTYDVVSGATPVGRQVATAEAMTQKFMCEYHHLRTPPSVSTVGKVLVRMGAFRRDNQVRLSGGRKVRALALVNTEHWKGQPEAAWRAELEKPESFLPHVQHPASPMPQEVPQLKPA